MATITSTDFLNYMDGVGNSAYSSIVGGESGVTRCVRFQIESPANGASHVAVAGQFAHGGGAYIAPRWYITTSDNSHANANSSAAYHGTLEMNIVSGVYQGTGSADVVLKPNTTYYLWLFPSGTDYSYWAHYGSFTITTSGSATVTIMQYHYGMKADGSQEFIKTTTHTALYGSSYTPSALSSSELPTQYTSSGSTYQLWDAAHSAVVVWGKKTGIDSYVLDGTYHTLIDVFYPRRTYTLSISAGTGSAITVTRNGTPISNGATITHGDVLTISFGVSTGYNLGTHTVNGSTFASGGTHTVSGAVSVVSTASKKTYTLSISAGTGSTITVTRSGTALGNGTNITHGDVLTIAFDTAEGYCLTEHTVNGVAFDSGGTHTVAGEVAVVAAAEVLAYAIGAELYHAFIGDGAGGSLYVAYIGDENGTPVPYGQVN